MDEDQRVLEHAFHSLGIGHEIWRQIAPVELHAFDDLERGLHRLGLFDGDDAVFPHFVHGLGDDFPDGGIVVRGNRAHLGDHVAFDRLTQRLQLADGLVDRLLDTALDAHRIGPGGHVLRALADDRLRQDGRRRRAVTGHVGGLARDLSHHAGAEVLDRIRHVDLFRDADAILGDGG